LKRQPASFVLPRSRAVWSGAEHRETTIGDTGANPAVYLVRKRSWVSGPKTQQGVWFGNSAGCVVRKLGRVSGPETQPVVWSENSTGCVVRKLGRVSGPKTQPVVWSGNPTRCLVRKLNRVCGSETRQGVWSGNSAGCLIRKLGRVSDPEPQQGVWSGNSAGCVVRKPSQGLSRAEHRETTIGDMEANPRRTPARGSGPITSRGPATSETQRVAPRLPSGWGNAQICAFLFLRSAIRKTGDLRRHHGVPEIGRY